MSTGRGWCECEEWRGAGVDWCGMVWFVISLLELICIIYSYSFAFSIHFVSIYYYILTSSTHLLVFVCIYLYVQAMCWCLLICVGIVKVIVCTYWYLFGCSMYLFVFVCIYFYSLIVNVIVQVSVGIYSYVLVLRSVQGLHLYLFEFQYFVDIY